MRWFRGGTPVQRLDPARTRCIDAYDRVEQLPRGAGRSAAWAAYALLTYGDKLVAAVQDDGYVDVHTAGVAWRSFELAATCLDPGGAVPASLPRWEGEPPTERQVRGMREALDALRTFLAFDLASRPDEGFAAQLAEIDRQLQKVDRLLVPRPTPELRGGICGALAAGLDDAYALGRALALG